MLITYYYMGILDKRWYIYLNARFTFSFDFKSKRNNNKYQSYNNPKNKKFSFHY